jgi:hypothetical protein
MQFGTKEGASLSGKGHRLGRKPAGRKFLQKHLFLQGPAVPFLEPSSLSDLTEKWVQMETSFRIQNPLWNHISIIYTFLFEDYAKPLSPTGC